MNAQTILSALLLALAIQLSPAATLSGSISGILTTAGSPYLVTSDVFIEANRQLTIEPGVVLQFQHPYDAMFIDGTLSAQGRADAPITFTTAEANKVPGSWEALYFRRADDTSSILTYCTIEYAGGAGYSDQAVLCQNASPTFRNCTIRSSRVHGITLVNSQAVLDNCQFLNNGAGNADAFPIMQRADSFPSYQNNTATGNGNNAIGVFAGDVYKSGTWLKDNLPYTIVQDTFIAAGRTLTINPGAVVQFQHPYDALIVDGTLSARGTSTSRILFTSDDTTKAPGQWEAIIIRSTSGTNTVLEYCDIESGAASGYAEEMIRCESASPTIRNSTIRNSRVHGLTLVHSDAVIQTSRFSSNGGTNSNAFPIVMRTDSLPTFINNVAENNSNNAIGVYGADVNRTGRWMRDNLPYTIVQDTYIWSGHSLTLDPGVVVQFQHPYDALFVDGTLLAKGTAAQPITFTSDKPQKGPGQWEAIIFRGTANTNSVLENCIVESAAAPGYSNDAIRVESASVAFLTSTIRQSGWSGIALLNSISRIERCRFLTNGAGNVEAFPIAMRTDSTGLLAQNTAAGNGNDAIAIFGGDIRTGAHWVRDELPYTIVQDTYVGASAILSVDPGVIVQFQHPYDALVVDGTLFAQGTAEQPIRFTSDEAVKAPGQWETIYFRGSATNSMLDHCIIEFAGAAGYSDQAVYLQGAGPVFRNCTIADNRVHGMVMTGARPAIENCRFLRNGTGLRDAFPIFMQTDALPRNFGTVATDNGNNSIGIFGGDYRLTGNWVRDNIPYTIVQDTYISSSAILFLDAGTTIQFHHPYDSLIVDGTLTARGTPGAPVVFTSNSTNKSKGQWESIVIHDSSNDAQTIFENCVFEFGGGNGADAVVSISAASPRFANCILRDSATDGMDLYNSAAPSLTSCQFLNNDRVGLRTQSGSKPVLSNCSFIGNSLFGVQNFDTAVFLGARGSYWGDPTGPFDNSNVDGKNQLNPNSKGDKVSEYVDWGGFLATDPVGVEYAPNIEISSSTLAFGQVEVGTSRDLVFAITNIGNTNLIIQSVTIDNSRFVLISPSIPATVAVGSQTGFQVRFVPQLTNEVAGTLSINSNDPKDPKITITLRGSGSISSQNCVPAVTGLYAWWPGEGNLLDNKGTNNATAPNGITYAAGQVGQAFRFDGVNQYLSTTIDVQPSAMPSTTWEAWVRPTHVNFGIRQQIFSHDDGGYDRSLLIEGGSSKFAIFTGGGPWIAGDVTPDQWQHVAVVFTPTDIEFYKNGVRTNLGSAPLGQSSGARLQIGRNPGFGEYYQGFIDEPAVYNRALTAADIQGIVSAGTKGKCALPPVGTPVIGVSTNYLAFKLVPFGETGQKSLIISNTGNGTLIVSNITTFDSQFRATMTNFTVAAGTNISLPFEYTPARVSLASTTARIFSNDPKFKQLDVALAGEGGDPFLWLNITQSTNGVEVSWPALTTNLVLESTMTLGPSERWSMVTNKPAVRAGTNYVEQPSSKHARFYRLNRWPNPAEPELGLGGITASIPPDWKPPFPVIETTSGLVSVATGGTLRLGSGAVLSVPAGALATNTVMTFSKLDVSVYSIGARDAYRVEPHGLTLNSPATMTLPIGFLPPGTTPQDIHVIRNSGDQGTDELPYVLNEAAGTIQVSPDHFSDTVVEKDASYLSTFFDAKNNPNRFQRLDVPYYTQGDTLWCFAAASQMMLKYYGIDVEPWDIAQYFKLRLDQSPPAYNLWVGNYSDLFAKAGVKVRETSGWSLIGRMNGYIIQQLDAGRPVFLIVQNGQHALVVVGYDADGFYVHDPSGHSIQFVNGTVDGTKLARHFFTWEEFLKACYGRKAGRFFVQVPMPAYTIVFDGAPTLPPAAVTQTAVSSLLVDGRVAGDLIRYVRPLQTGRSVSRFLWDGTARYGYDFVAGVDFTDPTTASLSDGLLLPVFLHNSEAIPRTITLRATLDGIRIYSSPNMTIPPLTTLRQTDIFGERNIFYFSRDFPGRVYSGDHTLLVEVVSDKNVVLDTVRLELELGPSRPDCVTATPTTSGAVITWNPNPEAASSALVYRVYRNGVPLGITGETHFIHAGADGKGDYTVSAYDSINNLEGPKSFPATGPGNFYLLRSAEPTITGDLSVFGPILSNRVTLADKGTTLKVEWNLPPMVALTNPACAFAMNAHASHAGSPTEPDTYTLSGYVTAGYSDGNTRSGGSATVLFTSGRRVMYDSRGGNIPGAVQTATGSIAYLTYVEVKLSKDFFFNYGEAKVRWQYQLSSGAPASP